MIQKIKSVLGWALVELGAQLIKRGYPLTGELLKSGGDDPEESSHGEFLGFQETSAAAELRAPVSITRPPVREVVNPWLQPPKGSARARQG